MFLRQLEQGNNTEYFRTGLDSWICAEKPSFFHEASFFQESKETTVT